MSLWPILDSKYERFRDLEAQLSDPDVATDPAKFGTVAKEHGALAKLVKPFLEFQRIEAAIAEAEALAADESDPDMKAMADEELAALRPKYDALKDKIEDQLLVDPSEDFDRIIVEIRAGTGGDEAALFAGDLYEMYTRYARAQGWTVEDLEHSDGEMGGFKEVTFGLRGDGVYQSFRYESGGHRVQRVPKTETQGRIHTSLATVGVMPEPEQAQVEIDETNDIEWERMRAGGAGGQHVNKTESAVRIWYRKGTPDEVEVKCQDERSQHKNNERAMRLLLLADLRTPAGQAAQGTLGHAAEPDRRRRPRRAYPHVQLPGRPGDRPPDRPDRIQDRRNPRRRGRPLDRPAQRARQERAPRGGEVRPVV